MKKQTTYFSITPLKMFLCSFCTMGLYDLYWAYRNWETIKKNKKENINPILRSWFFDAIFIGPLLVRIIKDTKSKPILWGAIGYLTFFYLQIFFNSLLYTTAKTIGSYVAVQIICFILIFLSALCMIPVQIAINKHNKKTDKTSKPEKSFLKGELAVISAAILLIIMSLGTTYIKIQIINNKRGYIIQENLDMILGASYRHIMGYDAVCRKSGYILKNYPIVFYDEFESQLMKLSDKLININLTVPQAWELVEPAKRKIVLNGIETELENMRKGLIIHTMADMTETSWQEILWEDKYNSMITFQEVCQILDNNADVIIETDVKLHQMMEIK